jgi:hypothetical protein
MKPGTPILPVTDRDCRLELWIEQRTGGRVRGLRVESVGERIVVHGVAGSYHVRQLAINAILEALETTDRDHKEWLELDIEVA